MADQVEVFFHSRQPHVHVREEDLSQFDSGPLGFPNSYFDPEKANVLYSQYHEQDSFADEAGVDGIMTNEHHSAYWNIKPSANLDAAAISFGCAVRYPGRVRSIFPSNIASSVICDSYLAMKLFKSTDMALNQGIKAVVEAFDADDRFSPFTPERAQYDPEYRKTLEDVDPQDFAQVMRDTIYALLSEWDGDLGNIG